MKKILPLKKTSIDKQIAEKTNCCELSLLLREFRNVLLNIVIIIFLLYKKVKVKIINIIDK